MLNFIEEYKKFIKTKKDRLDYAESIPTITEKDALCCIAIADRFGIGSDSRLMSGRSFEIAHKKLKRTLECIKKYPILNLIDAIEYIFYVRSDVNILRFRGIYYDNKKACDSYFAKEVQAVVDYCGGI